MRFELNHIAIGVAAGLSSLGSSAFAHPEHVDAQMIVNADSGQPATVYFYESAHPDQTALDLVEQDLIDDNEIGLKSVFDRTKSLVGFEQPIKVCFMDGLPEQHEIVVEAAQTWVDTGAGIAFNFGREERNYCIEDTDDSRSTIRITLLGRRNFSLVGREAFLDKYAGKPTMGIGFGEAIQLPLRRVIIQHEFGHALGLLHEHLNPAATCVDELNKEYIYQRLTEPDKGFTKEEIDRDILAMLRGSPDVENSTFDQASIMIYSLPPEFFKDPQNAKCKVGQPMELSQIDIREIKRHYPPDASEAARLARDMFQDLQLAIQSSGLSSDRRDKLATFAAGYASLTSSEFGDEYLEYANSLVNEASEQLERSQ